MAKSPAKKSPAKSAKKQADDTPILETLTAGLGLILVLGALAVIGWEAMQPRTPPAIALSLGEVRAAGAGWVAEVDVDNTGRQSAADVQVEAELTPPGDAPETASTTIAYVPGQASETVTLGFSTDPRAGALELTVRGWSEP